MTTPARALVVAALALAACKGGGGAGPDGLPGLDHNWTVAEQARAAAVLDRLCDLGPTRLPGYGSAAFARLVAAANRATLPAGPALERQVAMSAHTDAVLAMYLTYHRCGRPVETLAVNAALLEGYAAALPLSRELAARPDGTAAQRQARADGVAQIEGGLVGGIDSTVAMLVDPDLGAGVPLEVAARLGTAIALVRAELRAGALDGSIAHLAAAAAAEPDPTRRATLAAALAPLR
ncbi:MAG: hypothetical protein R3B06_13835 [Kofleriaceae bacterium]